MTGRAAPARILETVAQHSPTLFFSVPALYAAMLKAPELPATDFTSVRACLSAAEPLPAAVSERWQAITDVPILDGIGSTEMLHIYCSNTLEDLEHGTSGRPVPGYELCVVDERGQEVGPGEPGDLLVHGESCAATTGTSARRPANACAASGSSPATGTCVRADGPPGLPGPRRRHDQDRRACGCRRPTSSRAWSATPPSRRRR